VSKKGSDGGDWECDKPIGISSRISIGNLDLDIKGHAIGKD